MSETAARRRPKPQPAVPARFYAWYVVFVLTLAFMLAMLDRMLLVLLVGPLKADLALSDTQISLLHGLAFTALYVLCGLPLARLADRWNRCRVAGASIVAWSLATAACAAATGFVSLFVTRMAVGVGEAGLSPAANSVIADYFPPERVSKPIAYYSLGGTAGSGISLICGGAIIDLLVTHQVVLPGVGELRPWQSAFLIAGALGLLLSLLMLTVREPARRSAPAEDMGQEGVALLPFLGLHQRFLTRHMVGTALVGATILGMHAWLPTTLIRRFGWDAATTGFHYGVVVAGASVAGVLLGGSLVQRLGSKGVRASASAVAVGATLAAILPAIAAPIMPSPASCLAAAGLALFLMSIPVALAPVALQLLAPNMLRGQIYAVYVVVLSFIAYIGAPTAIALLTDHVFRDEAEVGRSIAVLAAFCLTGGSWLLVQARACHPPA